MSRFSVKVKRIPDIKPHPNADAIEFAIIDGTVLSLKRRIQSGCSV